MRAWTVALVLAATATAHAEDDGVPAPTSSPDTETYALPIMGIDAGAFASFGLGGMIMLVAAFEPGDDTVLTDAGLTLATAGIVTYSVAPALVHAGRGNPRGAMRSAFARVGLPIAGGMLAYWTDRHGEPERATVGAIAGAGVAMVLDWAIFARMPARTAPFVTTTPDGGVQAGIGGRF